MSNSLEESVIDPFLTVSDAIDVFIKAPPPEDISPRSWDVYGSGLRALVKLLPSNPAVGWLDNETVVAAFEKMSAMYSRSRCAQARAAWTKFRLWALRFDVDLPTGPDAKRRGPASTHYLPSREIGRAIYGVMRCIPTRALTHAGVLQLRWQDLRADQYEGHDVLMVPTRNGYVTLPQEAMADIKTLWAYSCGEDRMPKGPLFPAKEGGDEPMALTVLRKLLQQSREETRKKRKEKVRATETGEDSSRLDAVAAVLNSGKTLKVIG